MIDQAKPVRNCSAFVLPKESHRLNNVGEQKSARRMQVVRVRSCADKMHVLCLSGHF
ncbi:hypothetical protein HMPREF9946_00938 [Acetobacteraceae bacterium AT-5844]|nr:hypothetical protein HMPREF9946_00938 [Acetobacteraceae bacterium AT-5844]